MTTDSVRPASTDILPPSRNVAVLLLIAAWGLYLASLLLPALETRNAANGEMPAVMPGWEIVMSLAFPLWWLLVWPFGYLLVNVCFWVSPILLFVRHLRDKKGMIYPGLLVAAMLAAWTCLWQMWDEILWGYYAWASAITLTAIAFLIPLRPRAEPPDLEQGSSSHTS